MEIFKWCIPRHSFISVSQKVPVNPFKQMQPLMWSQDKEFKQLHELEQLMPYLLYGQTLIAIRTFTNLIPECMSLLSFTCTSFHIII